jgi:hypothetical protein
MKFKKNMLSAMMIGAFAATSALGTDLGLSLLATGTITAAPAWLVGGTSASSASFNFAQTAPGAGLNLDSTPLSVQLSHEGVTTAQQIALVRPANCSVGSTQVADADVAMVFDGSESATNGNVAFTPGTARSSKMRFKANYGTAKGAVDCQVAGSLTYQY